MQPDFAKEVLSMISKQELFEWTERNPMPDNYGESIYFYACHRMRMNWFYTLWRKYILRWKV